MKFPASAVSLAVCAGLALLVCRGLPAQEAKPDRQARIAELIARLADESFAVREAASKALHDLGSAARPALEQALRSPDAETASRAKAILGSLPKLTHRVLDGTGQPIPRATAALEYVGQPLPAVGGPPIGKIREAITLAADEEGWISVPPVVEAVASTASARIEHPEYGIAGVQVDLTGKDSSLRLPLVSKSSAAYARALRGQVVTPDGKPVAEAVVKCTEVRTPGQGLIEQAIPSGDVITDASGRFVCYLPASDRRKDERGELIPLNSRYRVSILTPGDDALFPYGGWHGNVQEERIELALPTRFHRFRFAAAGGGWIDDPKLLSQVRVQHDRRQNGDRVLTELSARFITAGGKLPEGTYVAQLFTNAGRIEYPPLVVTHDSPEQLDFTLPPEITYRGRLVHGISGKPIAEGMIIAYASTSRNNLALLSEGDWKMLEETPSHPAIDHPAIKRLGECYGVQAFVRSESDGRFAITRRSDQAFYGLIGFDRHSIPFTVRVGALKPDASQTIDVGDIPLYPAAKLLVRPVHDGQHLAVMPVWQPGADEQPEWFGKFQSETRRSDRDFEYVHWLALNELQPVYVPAGIKLAVRFETPYDDKWGPALVEAAQLDPAATKDIGDLHFTPALEGSVRVVTERGEPVEGVPVRRKYADEDSWSVAHNTDAQGRAQFYLRPNSKGQFRVSDLPAGAGMAPNLATDFAVEEALPAAGFTITISDAQVKLLRGK
jgi:hypothetical protein